MTFIKKLMLAVALTATATTASAQIEEITAKTNMLYDLTTSVSLGAEVQFAPFWSAEVTGSYNGWDIGLGKWRHWIVQPELRYWIWDDMEGAFFAANYLVGQINVGCFTRNLFGRQLMDSRFQGWVQAAGIGAGYAWRVSDYWKLETELTLGVAHLHLDRFSAASGHITRRNKSVTTFAPTKIAFTLAYIF